MLDPENTRVEPLPVQPLDYASAKVKSTNRMAAASLIFGLLLFIPFIPGILAILLGRKGQRVARMQNGHGAEMAKTGSILGITNIAVSLLLCEIAIPKLIEARYEARQIQCGSNLRQIGMALTLYSMDYGGQLPATLDETVPYFGGTTRVLVCPETGNAAPPIGGPYDYVYLGSGIRLKQVNDPGKFILAHEMLSNHSSGWVSFLYADGHTERWMLPQAKQILSELASGQNPPRDEVMNQLPVEK